MLDWKMLKKIYRTLLIITTFMVLYFVAWPVPIDPVAWKSPPNPGYRGAFESNERLKEIELLPIGDNHGPEGIALDAQGRIYTSTHEGRIVRLQADGSNPENWVETSGRPLGMDFDNSGNLIVADAFRGLLSIAQDGTITELATVADGIPVRYANDLAVAADGKIYFSDASTKFGAREWGGTYEASLLDLLEHGSHGRLLVFDMADGSAKTLLDDLNFANGVAISRDQAYVLINETGSCRVIRYWLTGPQKGQAESFVEGLPAFPDNISTGSGGRFWVALVSPRNGLVDKLSHKPFMRKVLQRMPVFLRPKAESYGHIIAVDGDGKVVEDLQDPSGGYPMDTSVVETEEYLYIGSLVTVILIYEILGLGNCYEQKMQLVRQRSSLHRLPRRRMGRSSS